YCASKAALIMATKALAMEIAGKEVRANVVCPGVIDTPMLRASFETAVDPDAAYRQILGRNILSRIARPEEVAHGILYLTSDEASFVTGSTLTVDGGRVFH
ncbi:MAG: SDR family NAD(P)-dependent oxidoreductase, partial [Rhizobiaceae bacterium]